LNNATDIHNLTSHSIPCFPVINYCSPDAIVVCLQSVMQTSILALAFSFVCSFTI